MKNTLLKLPTLDDIYKPDNATTHIGQVVDITDDYRAKIDYPGNPLGPVIARSSIQVPDYNIFLHSSVILIFENNDPSLPVIVGLVHESIFTPNIHEDLDFSNAKRHDVVLDGKRLVLEADKEIVLCCGRSSITLRADGKIIVKGKNIVSRAAATNKIKGACVDIN